MTFFNKLKDAMAERAAEGIAASLTVLLVWAVYQIVPIVLPAIEAAISKQVLLALLVSSLILNVVFLCVVWFNAGSGVLRLKYGIYWDKQKNPHCPSCEKPLSDYNDYGYSGTGYYCKPCNQVFPLSDALGKRIPPAQAISEL
jgi:uncharacterized protein YqhQ